MVTKKESSRLRVQARLQKWYSCEKSSYVLAALSDKSENTSHEFKYAYIQVVNNIRDHKDYWTQQIERMKEEIYRKVTLHYYPTGRRDSGTPRRRWKGSRNRSKGSQDLTDGRRRYNDLYFKPRTLRPKCFKHVIHYRRHQKIRCGCNTVVICGHSRTNMLLVKSRS